MAMQHTGTMRQVVQGVKFPLGRILMTGGVNNAVADDAELAKAVLAGLRRHARGDWGDVCADDKRENDRSLIHGYRVLSSYPTPAGKTYSGQFGIGDDDKFWIITEASRECTTILFPSEY